MSGHLLIAGNLRTVTSYDVGPEGGQPIYPVSEPGPGVVHAFISERGTPAQIVREMGPGVQPVLLENPPLSPIPFHDQGDDITDIAASLLLLL